MKARAALLGLCLAVLPASFALNARADDTTTMRLATIAPQESPWGKVFKAWQKAVKEKSHGALAVQIFYGNQQGDEVAMVGKMRTRQLDGAALTAIGLAQIYRNVLVFQLPGLFRDWATLDKARDAMRPLMDPEFDKAGFKVVGWGDVGIAHLMSKGFEVRVPNDLKHKNTFYFTGDPVGPALFSTIGDITAKQITIPEVLPALTNGTANIVLAPALAAEQLQWSSLVDHLQLPPAGAGIGALVVASQKLAALPEDLRKVFLETGENAGQALTANIRTQDDLAFARLKQRMTTYDLTQAEQDTWRKVFTETDKKLRANTFDVKLFDMAVRLSGHGDELK